MSMKTESIKRVLRLAGIVPDQFSVWLTASQESRAFHCPVCGKFMFYHQHRVIALVQDDMSQILQIPPTVHQCPKDGTIIRIHIM